MEGVSCTMELSRETKPFFLIFPRIINTSGFSGAKVYNSNLAAVPEITVTKLPFFPH